MNLFLKGFRLISFNFTVFEVTTEDGKILTNFKVSPKEPTAEISLLIPGVLDSSDTWFANHESLSIGHSLLNKGHTLYLVNLRGNTYGRRHLFYTHNSPENWTFSIDELAKFDLPAVINRVKEMTGNEQINLIAHSQGTQVFLASYSLFPNLYEPLLKARILLSPINDLKHMESNLLRFLSNRPFIGDLMYQLIHEVFARHHLISKGIRLVCRYFTSICVFAIQSEVEDDLDDVDLDRFISFLDRYPCGTGVKNLHHLMQIYRSGQLEQFDHGEAKNIELYDSVRPPRYEIERLPGSKVCLIGGDRDRLSRPADLLRLSELIKAKRAVILEGYGHLSILLSKRRDIINQIDSCLKEINRN